MSEDLTVVSHEQDGRILTGVGVEADALASTMDRHTPEDAQAAPATADASPTDATPDASRNEQGQFAKPPRGQKRFDQLTGEREAEKRRAEAAERERDELKARIAEFERRQQTAPAAPEPAAAPAQSDRPITKQILEAMPAALRTYEQFLAIQPDADYEEFRDARNLWLYQAQSQAFLQSELDARIRQSIEADRASRTHAERLESIHSKGRAVYPDFDAVVNAPHMLEPWPQEKVDLLQQLGQVDGVEHIQYQLGKNPDLAHRLREMSPMQFGLEIAKLMPAAAVASPASTARTMSPPPAPYQPVTGGGTTTGPSSAQLAERGDYDFDKSGYREKRAKERGVSRRW